MSDLLLITICFFENAEKELQRIANFIGLPDAKIGSAAELSGNEKTPHAFHD